MQIIEGKPLSQLSTFGIGGEAAYFAVAQSTPELSELLKFATKQQLSFFILGKGSNCLFDDRGFDGLVILNQINFCEENGGIFHVGGGYSFSLLGSQTVRKGWSGLEFAAGIPGSVGGAVYMNAGANGVETAEALLEVEWITEEGTVQTFHRKDLDYGYRSSPFQKMKGAVSSAKFQLSRVEGIKKKQHEMIHYRKETQPYGEKSAGCVFRNPENGSAGALIEELGLKGVAVGDAMISEIHGNFIVNKGTARAQDVLDLVAKIRQRVKEVKGIDLEMEVKYIPYDISS